jgi:hypothetical protein
MKIKFLLLLTGILFNSCQSNSPQALKQLVEQFEAELPKIFPDYATAMGVPLATDILIIPTKLKLQENLDFCQKYLKAFEDFDQLNGYPYLNQQRTEKLEILNGMIQQMSGTRSPFNDPSFYNIYPAIAWRNSQLQQHQDLKNVHLLEKTLTKVPNYFYHAKANLDNPNIPQTTAAINLQDHAFNFLNTTVAEQIRSLPENKVRKNLEIVHQEAIIAVKDYAGFCRSILLELKKLEQSSDKN